MKTLKMIGTLMTVLLLACGNSFAAGGDVNATGDGNTAIGTYQEQTQTQSTVVDTRAESTATVGNTTATGGDATLNYTERQQVPQYQPPSVNVQIGSDTYGTSVAQFGNSDILGKGCRTWTMAKHRTKLGAMKKVEGAVSWDKMMDLIKAYPDIENEFAPIGEGLVYRYDSIDLAKNIGLTEENYIGILPYDTELSKDYFVPQSYLGERACYDGSQLFGANIVVKIGEFSSGHFVASGKSISGGGILSTILSCITSGGISAGIGSTGTKNSKIITTGAVYALFRVDGWHQQPCKPLQLTRSKSSSLIELRLKISELREILDRCPTKNWNNGRTRSELGYKLGLLGEKLSVSDEGIEFLSEAIANLDVAIADLTNGVENDGTKTRNMAVAQRVIRICQKNRAVAYELGGNEQLAAEYRKAIAARKVELRRAAKK